MTNSTILLWSVLLIVNVGALSLHLTNERWWWALAAALLAVWCTYRLAGGEMP